MLKALNVVETAPTAMNQLAMKWIEHKLNETIAFIDSEFENYRLSEAVKGMHGLIWGEFCDWYLEIIKPAYEQPIDRQTLEFTLGIFEKLMTLLHPFMPFITEEIWSKLKDRQEGDDCVVSQWPTAGNFDQAFLKKFETLKEVIKNIRDVRAKNQLKPKELLELLVKEGPSTQAFFAEDGLKETIAKIGFLSSLRATSEEVEATAFIAGTEQYYVVFEKQMDAAAEIARIEKDLAYCKGFVKGIEKKLSNEKFVNGAPEKVVNAERKKLADNQAKIALLEEELLKYS